MLCQSSRGKLGWYDIEVPTRGVVIFYGFNLFCTGHSNKKAGTMLQHTVQMVSSIVAKAVSDFKQMIVFIFYLSRTYRLDDNYWYST